MSADRQTADSTVEWPERLRAVTASLILAVGGLVVAVVVTVVGFQVLTDAGVVAAEDVTVRYPVGTVLTGIAFVLVVAGYIRATGRTDLLEVRVPSLVDAAWVVGGVVALLATLVVLSAILEQLGIHAAQHRIEEIGQEHPAVLLVMIPLAFLVIGPTEELLFRGTIQGLLRRVYRPTPAILIASVMFAIGHVFALSGPDASRVSTLVIILLLGAILGAVYEFTDNLVVPALVHGTYDAVAFIQIYVTATGLA